MRENQKARDASLVNLPGSQKPDKKENPVNLNEDRQAEELAPDKGKETARTTQDILPGNNETLGNP